MKHIPTLAQAIASVLQTRALLRRSRLQTRSFGCVLAVILALGGGVARAQGTIHVFLIGGQSNADGRANPRDLPPPLRDPQEDVPTYYGITPSGTTTITKEASTTLRLGLSYRTGLFGPEITFGRSMADFYKTRGDSIALIKYATGGTNLAEQWKAEGDGTPKGDGPNYQNFQTIVQHGLGCLKAAYPTATITVSGMIWMQGESDCNPTRSGQYAANLTAYIKDVRATYGASLPFVIGQLSAQQKGTNKDAHGTDADREAVRAAQEAVTAKLALTALVNTDTFDLNADELHFNSSGQQELGAAFATHMQKLVAANAAK